MSSSACAVAMSILVCISFDICKNKVKQLYLIVEHFSIELFSLINVKSTFIKVNGWNFINVLHVRKKVWKIYFIFPLFCLAKPANYFIFHNFNCTD